MRVYVVRKWALRRRSRFVCWNITRVSLLLLCNVHFVQNRQRNGLRVLADLKARIFAAVRNIIAPMLTGVCGKNLNIVSMCAVSPVVHTSKISSCQKKKKSVFLWLWTIPLSLDNWLTVHLSITLFDLQLDTQILIYLHTFNLGRFFLVFLLYMFVITENIMKRPVFCDAGQCSTVMKAIKFLCKFCL